VRGAPKQHVDGAVDGSFALRIVEGLASIGSSDLGFRVAGTPEDAAACDFLAGQMAAIGLEGVRTEPVPVDGWRFHGASLAVGDDVLGCSAFGGVPGTPPGGLEGRLVFVGEGTRGELEGRDLDGCIALFDWRGEQLHWPSLTAAELGHAGAQAVVCTCLPGARYYQGDRALGSFDGMWLAGSPPLAYVAHEDAAVLIERLRAGELRARLTVDAELTPGATAHNVVGVLPGRSREAPIVIGGHHDCWFAAAFDDATGVAAALSIAKALVNGGYEPERPIIFTSHTAEEYGLTDSAFGWLTGAWWQIAHEHPEWARSAALYLNIEGTGMARPMGVDSPPELRRFARRVLGRARRDGLLRRGTVWGVPRTGTEQWPFAAAGVPSLGVADEAGDYMRVAYHTQHDRIELVDPQRLADAVKLYARVVIAADRDPGALLDLGARSRHLRRHGGLAGLARCGVDPMRLLTALARHEEAAARPVAYSVARAAFHATATVVEGLNGNDKQDFSHRQAALDLDGLTAAARRLAGKRRQSAVIALERVGRNALAGRLSEAIFALDAARHQPDHPRIAWAGPYQTPSPNLWAELAGLRGEPGARAPGAWIAASVEAARGRALDEASARLDRVAAGFERAAELLETPA
jgi:Iap family predicted aminopeptidase